MVPISDKHPGSIPTHCACIKCDACKASPCGSLPDWQAPSWMKTSKRWWADGMVILNYIMQIWLIFTCIITIIVLVPGLVLFFYIALLTGAIFLLSVKLFDWAEKKKEGLDNKLEADT